jgi:hypothetical protein
MDLHAWTGSQTPSEQIKHPFLYWKWVDGERFSAADLLFVDKYFYQKQ